MCGGRSSILHYGPLIETICMPWRRMGKASESYNKELKQKLKLK